MSNSRRKEVALARHIAIYLSKQLTDSSLKTIGLHFGGRDHSTVIHSLKIMESTLKSDIDLNRNVQLLTEKAKKA
jgi:chromosomal replication initiator protein